MEVLDDHGAVRKRRLNNIPTKTMKTLPEGAPYQPIGGELIMTPSPIPYHQIVKHNIEFELSSFVREKRIGIVFGRAAGCLSLRNRDLSA